jgi:hypothetical protein
LVIVNNALTPGYYSYGVGGVEVSAGLAQLAEDKTIRNYSYITKGP